MQPDADTCPVAPLWIEPEPSLRETAIRMAEHATSSILVGAPGELVSILTEHDLARAVARDVPNSTPVVVTVMEAHLMNGPTRWPD